MKSIQNIVMPQKAAIFMTQTLNDTGVSHLKYLKPKTCGYYFIMDENPVI